MVGQIFKFSWNAVIPAMLTSGLSVLMYWQLAGMSTAKMVDGRPEEVGVDLDTAGLHQYMMDYIYVSSVTVGLSALTLKAWFIFLVVNTH